MAENTTSKFTLTVVPEELSAVRNILDDQGIMYLTSKDSNGQIVLQMDLTEKESNDLQNAFIRYNVKTSVVKFVNVASNAVINGTEYIAKDVIVPVGKIGLKVGAAAGRIVAESAVIAGASAINVISDQGRQTVDTIKSSDEYLEAKQNLSKATNKLKSFLGIRSSCFNLTRV